MSPHAVISGASIAGPALAHQLNARGWRTTVLERAPQLREEGQNIDIRGVGREVCRRMGIEDAVLAAGTGEVGLRFVDDDGAAIAVFPAGEGDTNGGTAEAEILRGELSRILYERTPDTDYRFGEQIAGITEGDDGATVTLTGGDVLTADVVVLAEGTRSRTRDAVFTPAGITPDITELGLYIAYLTIPRTADDDQWWRWYSAVGSRSVSLRPDNLGTTRVFLSLLSNIRGLEALDRADQAAVLRRTFADAGWQTGRVLDRLDDAPYYFDAVAQVRMPRWSTGRTVLLGDAAWSPGPFGAGTTLALTGAYVLAGELRDGADVRGAFDRYETTMRPFVDKAQDIRPSVLRVMNPQSRAGRAVNRVAMRGMSAVVNSPLGGLLGKLTSPPVNTIELPDYDRPRSSR
ncbi:FAD-dependent monooxygenase [Pseudonocardia phyllosphaerae]|uniref:FAD-dependent monooxygenase n=1 Tax=Pseudonocardia phyllosphaerae TaxID=3390502 RepID=UPI00397D98CA